MDWTSILRGFKAYLALERAYSTHTLDAYLSDLDKLQQYLELLERKALPAHLSTEDLRGFLTYLNKLGLGRRSQARILSSLKTFYKYLQIEQITTEDPTSLLEAPRLDRHLPEVLSYIEVQTILQAIDLSTPHGVRNRAMLETLYACGLRVSELTQLQLSNLYLEIGFIKVSGKGNKERLIPIGGEAVKHINLYRTGIRMGMMNIQAGEEDYLFLNRRGKKLSRVMVFNIVKATAARAGVKKNVSPHTFRHAFATHLLEGGADLKAVQDMLGHESITTTEIYTHLDTQYLRETILNFHPRNQSRK